MLTIELGQEKEPTYCPCCGGVCRSAYGFVYRDGDAYAIYHATWSESHPEAGVDIAIDFDEWGESSRSETKYSIGLLARSTESRYQFQFLAPQDSAWSSSENRGRILTREEALAHPQKDEFLLVAEHIVLDDPRVKNALGHLPTAS